jgi:signal transduction histidine kinase/ActR/RegA family two-component response regulator
LGTLSFASRTRDAFADEELAFLQTICHYVANAYERLRLIRELREEDRKKDDFLATLAHELRNPLAPIRNATEFLRLTGSSDPDAANARDIIDRQVRQMTRLVDDLLDISRVTRGKVALQRERLSLGLVLTNAVESSRPLIEQGAHTLKVDLPSEPLYIEGDPTRLEQVFGNLLTNAAKYTDRGGAIHVSAERACGAVVVTVRDNGIGVAREHLPRLFDMFSQIEPAIARTQGGLGIGLALVKSLVELHGGRVKAFSEGPGAGSRFVVELPLLESLPTASEVTDPVESTIKSGGVARRVLVADDNVDSVRSLAMMLSIMGHEVRTAQDGLEAVRTAAEFRPDVILLDIGMPRMNGYEAAATIRKEPWGQSTTMAALTGWGQAEDKRRAEEAGFDRHFTKPVDATAVAKLLRDSPRRTR